MTKSVEVGKEEDLMVAVVVVTMRGLIRVEEKVVAMAPQHTYVAIANNLAVAMGQCPTSLLKIGHLKSYIFAP